jgi:hypothetical protein
MAESALERRCGAVRSVSMKLASLLATAVMFTASDRATAEDSNNAKVVPKTENTEQKTTPVPTEPISPEKSIPAGGELDQDTRARTRDDVIRETLRDRRSK